VLLSCVDKPPVFVYKKILPIPHERKEVDSFNNQEKVSMKVPCTERKLKTPDLVIQTLSDLGVDQFFHLPGNTLAPFYDILRRQKKIKPVLFKHEQAACFAAAGYALVTNRTGVCMVMNGPGVTNLISAVAECYYQSIPLIVITVDNPRNNFGMEDFHEVDSFTMLRPITKKILNPTKVEDIQKAITEALRSASTGRPGPVYLNIPVTLMGQEAPLKAVHVKGEKASPTISQVKRALKLIDAAKDPVIFAGSGVVRSGAEKELGEFVTLSGIPLLTSLGGRGIIPEGKSLIMGTPSYTFDVSFLKASDLFIVLGTRLNPVNLRMGRLQLPKKMVQVDSDRPNPKFKKADIYVQSDVREFLLLLNKEIKKRRTNRKRTASTIYTTYKKSYRDFTAADYRTIAANPSKLSSQKFLLALSQFLEKRTAALFVDSIWIPYTHLLPRARTARSFFSMRSYGCLGFALPAALGACLAERRKKVISLSGDGAFLFNCQDLSTAATYRLNNFIQIVLNNSGYSSLHDLACAQFDRQSEYYLWNRIDYHRFAESLGVKAITIDSPQQITAALTKAFSGNGPYLINVATTDQGNLKGAFWTE
jgi:acetolactate synthase-1/2/3 large subunit